MHLKCFICNICNIGKKMYKFHDEKYFHLSCFHKNYSPSCAHCSQTIENHECYETDGNFLHTKCIEKYEEENFLIKDFLKSFRFSYDPNASKLEVTLVDLY